MDSLRCSWAGILLPKGWCRALHVSLALWALTFVVATSGMPEVCKGLQALQSITQVHVCADELATAEHTPENISKALRKVRKNVAATREACSATAEKITQLGCKHLSDLAYQLVAEGTFVLASCLTQDDADLCLSRSRRAAAVMAQIWQGSVSEHQNVPTGGMVSGKLAELANEVLRPLMEEAAPEISPAERGDLAEAPLPAAWQVAAMAADKLKFWLEGYIWRETHWLWLTDSLNAGRVVHTTWGSPEEWKDKFGVHDCHAESPLIGAPPRYIFSDFLGMRWEILAELLKDLYNRRGRQGPLLLVEIGVFSGILADKLLKELDFIQMIGIDPYIGSDGTFPGTFSETLDPDVAMYKAALTMEPYGKRAALWTTSSEAAAASMPEGMVDALFVDGCHLYDCVRQDLDLWLPKLRRDAETLVAGHDFSPQWPGVVRAVHEQRTGGQVVNLASDWLFWWHEGMA